MSNTNCDDYKFDCNHHLMCAIENYYYNHHFAKTFLISIRKMMIRNSLNLNLINSHFYNHDIYNLLVIQVDLLLSPVIISV